MKLRYTTPMLEVNAFSAEELIRTSQSVPDRANLAAGEQGAAERLEDFILP